MIVSREFAELSAADVGAVRSSSVAVLPVGAIEQHGPHLPLNTDALVAEAAARAVVEQRGAELDLWLLPALAFGRSVEHVWAPGTLSLSTATFAAVLDDIGRSVAATGVRRLVFVNGHGGNISEIQTALRDIRLRHGLMTFATNTFVPVERDESFAGAELGLGIHGGAMETSLVLHLRPELVDLSAARPRIPRRLNDNEHVRFGGSVAFGWLSDDFGPDGYLGDPTRASAEAGERGFSALVAALGDQLAEVARFDFADFS
ncbi:creatinine amidohydrolase [Saccharopolyspora kobensis]|uniref:Creatinine amidohydrolase n=1 Tax=Saccharopolyspora kobensis TaxID=146035 RepID=A0A1H5ZYM6_9PSEU|nr:creatininase family protein [Saccharopolyspora kobensis]SEG41301.1 creatinine amidohydrolase [Saccharopolyspora kobensis]SFE16167.1 creatinine amidohydrolase [Saccharopolyspora kobensis]